MTDVYRYHFAAPIPLEDVESSVVLALLSAASLHGESQVRLDAGHYFDLDQRACVIDAGTLVGRDLNKLFVGYLRREFGDDTFTVERVARQPRLEEQQEGA